MSGQLNRKPLRINNRKSVKQHFDFNVNLGYKSKADPSVVTWAGRGRGVQGESVNSSGDVGSKQMISKIRKPM